jgi:hypothetical protein
MTSEIGKFIEITKNYLELKFEIFKLDAQDQVTRYFMRFSYLVASGLILLVTMLFLALGFANYINEILVSKYLGFFIIAFVFFTMLTGMLIIRKSKRLHSLFKKILDYFIFD